MTHFRKNLVAAALALAALPMASYAAPITLTTSVGNITGITEFDWAPSPVIAIGGNTAFTNRITGACAPPNQARCDFDVYSQGRLAAFNVGASVPGGLNSTWEITYEIGFRERIISASSSDTDGDGTLDRNTADFAFRTGEPNYFRMYFHDTANADYLAGTGFTDGTLILDGNVAPAQPFISDFTASIAPVTLDIDGNPILPADQDVVIQDLDQTNNGDNWSGTQTVTGAGSTTPLNLLISPVTLNPLFFVNTLVNSLTMDNLSQQLPFTTVDPSKSFNWDSTGSGLVGDRIVLSTPNQICAGGAEGPGCTNGLTGPSNIFQTDPNSPIDGQTIPEPASLALLGIGLLGMAAGGRRVNPFSRRRNANA